MNELEYKGYYGSIEYEEDGSLYGTALGLVDCGIQYQGNTHEELIQDFKDGVESYLDVCERKGIEPEKPQYVSFHMPLSVYEKIDELANKAGIYMEAYVINSVGNPVAAQA